MTPPIIKDPDSKTLPERRLEREENEKLNFDEDHYLCDLYQSDQIDHLLGFKTTWDELLSCDKELVLKH